MRLKTISNKDAEALLLTGPRDLYPGDKMDIQPIEDSEIYTHIFVREGTSAGFTFDDIDSMGLELGHCDYTEDYKSIASATLKEKQ